MTIKDPVSLTTLYSEHAHGQTERLVHTASWKGEEFIGKFNAAGPAQITHAYQPSGWQGNYTLVGIENKQNPRGQAIAMSDQQAAMLESITVTQNDLQARAAQATGNEQPASTTLDAIL